MRKKEEKQMGYQTREITGQRENEKHSKTWAGERRSGLRRQMVECLYLPDGFMSISPAPYRIWPGKGGLSGQNPPRRDRLRL
jgi:hypothetical protein